MIALRYSEHITMAGLSVVFNIFGIISFLCRLEVISQSLAWPIMDLISDFFFGVGDLISYRVDHIPHLLLAHSYNFLLDFLGQCHTSIYICLDSGT